MAFLGRSLWWLTACPFAPCSLPFVHMVKVYKLAMPNLYILTIVHNDENG